MYNITDIKPYVYLGIHKVTKKFYIGVRYGNVKIKKAINEDFGKIYKTSSKEVKPIFDEFEWTIIKIFATSDDALEYEDTLIRQHWGDPLLINKNRGGKKFKRPENYVRKLSKEKKITTTRSEYFTELWKNPDFKKSQLEKRKNKKKNKYKHFKKRTKEWKSMHSKIMKEISQNSKNICRVCRLSDRKEMTVQNFSRYPI